MLQAEWLTAISWFKFECCTKTLTESSALNTLDRQNLEHPNILNSPLVAVAPACSLRLPPDTGDNDPEGLYVAVGTVPCTAVVRDAEAGSVVPVSSHPAGGVAESFAGVMDVMSMNGVVVDVILKVKVWVPSLLQTSRLLVDSTVITGSILMVAVCDSFLNKMSSHTCPVLGMVWVTKRVALPVKPGTQETV